MAQSYVLINIIVVAMMMMMMMMIGVAFSGDTNRELVQIEKPIRVRNVFPQNRNAMSFVNSSPIFFLPLLKHKVQYQKLDKIPTSTTTPITPPLPRSCICVPFYLCDSNQTIITDGTGIIDFRVGSCPGIFEVCCYLRNVTIPPATIPPPTPPITFPTASPIPTVLPNCICVEISLCDPNGIVTIFGEGVISPRQQYILCPNANQVCCRLLATSTQPPTTQTPTTIPSTSTTMTTTTLLCFVCNNTVQCFTCTIVIAPDGTIDPRFSQILARQNVCALTNLYCQPSPSNSSITNLLGPLKNPGTPQACYCVKTWLCSAGNVISPDGLGIIDPRFTACSSADQVCCRLAGIDLQGLRGISVSSSGGLVARSDHSTPEITCGIQNNSYAPPQPASADSGKTYFAEFPWMVALLVKSTTGDSYVFQCGASMINNEAILTAAHCVINQKPENLIVRFGQWDIRSNVQPLPVQEANILAISIHPSYYSGGLFHDVAVLVLEKPVVYRANVAPICLPEQGAIFPTGSRCLGIGWGSNSYGPEGKYQAELRKVDLPIVDRADCQTRLQSTKLGQYFQLHGSFICAGGETNRDTCRGDGGGPLICPATTGQFFQAGIVSWGIGCGTSNVPAVYASVSQHRQWIDQQLATFGV
ncbi:serine proteinase stubble-like [Nylanderia fulva]|uniref:serine proteinase stubble-like n=1 Tax=Nylanderia fulva TaxID=613905 RepID=UPI0010FB3801|nr:serine proteinase stubble-like [Nylanderia fulva]